MIANLLAKIALLFVGNDGLQGKSRLEHDLGAFVLVIVEHRVVLGRIFHAHAVRDHVSRPPRAHGRRRHSPRERRNFHVFFLTISETTKTAPDVL